MNLKAYFLLLLSPYFDFLLLIPLVARKNVEDVIIYLPKNEKVVDA